MCATIELKHHYDEQLKELVGSHQRELTKIQGDLKVELDRMQKALDVVSWHALQTTSNCLLYQF